ncbi:tRNA (guanosine(37)-N1)-methyltransferase TrmD [Salibacteraceae bacterium]|nr:tRNA (guanosine(37)-N1)-methyltransferase TrmD [Salibacteraceae bacterium]MDB9709748.1 tRNA (guanosine(37)-N1)-methyltransferase TrmD [Salibacteraceae bacterium]HAQ69933.1 tRNA (guanosine(37)-N1)-methyltransferase TrmD [Flavobacteriales bacterium]
MRIDIITALPSLLQGPFSDSILKRAIDNGLAEVNLHDLRAYGSGKHRQIDDYQFGGGAGMVMMIEPIETLINELKDQRTYDEVIYMTPDGEVFNQSMANSLSLKGNLIILCGHYKGIDERVRELLITKEVSIGDYVLSGGELAAAVVSDAIIRLIPGVLNNETSALSDSFQDDLLAPPVYTRPAEYKGLKVPEILLGGNFGAIDKWRHEQAEKRTEERRPDIWNKKQKTED